MKIGDLCKREVVCAGSGARLMELSKLMRNNHVGSVVIVDGDRRPVGIVTDRDIVVEVIAAGLEGTDLAASDVMTGAPVLAREDDDALWSLKVMRDRGIRRLPVVDGEGRLVGIVTLDDVVEHIGVAIGDIVQLLGSERAVEGRRRH